MLAPFTVWLMIDCAAMGVKPSRLLLKYALALDVILLFTRGGIINKTQRGSK